jgi:hypothetical protein
VSPGDRDEDVDSSRSRRLREALELQQVERVLHEACDLDDVLEGRSLRRVEIEHDPVGTVGLVDARRPRVQVDAAHVRHPHEREVVVHDRVVDDLLLALTGRRRLCRACDPVRHVRRRLLLEKALPLPAVGIALHREWSILEVRNERLGDVSVVGNQVALRDALGGPERLVEIREPERPAPSLQLVRERRALAAHVRCLLVVPQAEIGGRS